MLNTCIFHFKQAGHRCCFRSEWIHRKEVDRKKRKKNLPGRRASDPHKIVNLCLAPWLQPVEWTGEGSRVEKCRKYKSVAGIKEEEQPSNPDCPDVKGRKSDRQISCHQKMDRFQVRGRRDSRNIQCGDSVTWPNQLTPPNWLGVASLNHSLYLKRLSDIKNDLLPFSSLLPLSPRLPLWFTIEEMNLKFQS